MSVFRRVSSLDTQEALEVNVNSASANPNGTYGISVSNISTWPDEVDFITYARDSDGSLDESSRVVWTGTKDDDTFITATRVGENTTYIPGPDDFATVVPTHYWSNNIVDGIKANIVDDGTQGLLSLGGSPLLFKVGGTQPVAVPGRTIIYFRPIGA